MIGRSRLRRLRASVRMLSSPRRSRRLDLALATLLAGVAGCANAGGFIVLGQYTSHMTGYLSQVADNVVLQNLALVAQGAVAIALFVAGAAFSAFLINWARRNSPGRQYALPLACQGALFLCFALFGDVGSPESVSGLTALGILCFIMGLQNATITKISGAVIRTTHATGLLTDVGIELGRAAYGRVAHDRAVGLDPQKFGALVRILVMFVIGGLCGAIGYGAFGFYFSLPLGFAMLAVSMQRFM